MDPTLIDKVAFDGDAYPAASTTWTVKDDVCEVDGVPLIVPFEARLSPEGSEPATRDHV